MRFGRLVPGGAVPVRVDRTAAIGRRRNRALPVRVDRAAVLARGSRRAAYGLSAAEAVRVDRAPFLVCNRGELHQPDGPQSPEPIGRGDPACPNRCSRVARGVGRCGADGHQGEGESQSEAATGEVTHAGLLRAGRRAGGGLHGRPGGTRKVSIGGGQRKKSDKKGRKNPRIAELSRARVSSRDCAPERSKRVGQETTRHRRRPAIERED